MERLRGCHAPAGSQLGTPEELALTWDHYLWRRYDNDVGVTRLKYRLCRSGIGRVAAAWVALRHAGDWRWMLRREDSPRYPTLRRMAVEPRRRGMTRERLPVPSGGPR